MKAADEKVITKAQELVLQRTGIVIPPHRRYLVRSALRHAGGDNDLEKGLRRLLGDSERWEALISALTVGETYLFRHYGHYEALRRLAIERRRQRRRCRVLCAGCATGEEAWSAAAVIADVFGAKDFGSEVLGWDIDGVRIGRARRGRYRSWSVRHGLKDYDDYFCELDDTVIVGDRLRSLTDFETVNLAALPLPERGDFDAIFFRNVAIYWMADRIQEVVNELTKYLVEDGLLFVGPADPVQMEEGWVKRIDHDAILFSIARVGTDTAVEGGGKKWRQRAKKNRQKKNRSNSSSKILRNDTSTPQKSKLASTSKLRARASSGGLSTSRWGSTAAAEARIRARVKTRTRSRSHARRKDDVPSKSPPVSVSNTEASTQFVSRTASGSPDVSSSSEIPTDDPVEQARILADQANYDEALALLEPLASPLPVSVRLLKGVVLLNLKRAEEAARLFKQCVFLEPRERAHRQWLAVAYETLGQNEDAQREWRNLARLSEESTASEGESKAGPLT